VFLSHFFDCFRGCFLSLFFAGVRLGLRSCHLMGPKGRYTPCGHEVSTLQMVLLFWARDIKTWYERVSAFEWKWTLTRKGLRHFY
jgi:hypothetical protein